MTKEADINTEQTILDAAEKVFINKGYAATKTTEIAKEAGVTHAMLHYYYRTKENIFSIVFQNKVKMLAVSFFSVIGEGKSFTEIVRLAIEQHFNFIKSNPRLGLFIINEINSSEKNNRIWSEIATPILSNVISSIKELMDIEIEKGRIRPVHPFDFILTVISLNIFPFIAQPLLKDLNHFSDEELELFFEHRKQENTRLALLMLQP